MATDDADRGHAERRFQPGGRVVGSCPSYGDIAIFIGGALASGIVGNAAYDALKTTVAKLVPRGSKGSPFKGPERELIAKLAARARCAEVDLPVPSPTDPCNVKWEKDNHGYIYHLEFRYVVAKVVIPEGDLDGRSIQVTLHGPSDPDLLPEPHQYLAAERRRYLQ